MKVDLPYSNFAYDQTGTPWPINQAVYVDYMLFMTCVVTTISRRTALPRCTAITRNPAGMWAGLPTGACTPPACFTRSPSITSFQGIGLPWTVCFRDATRTRLVSGRDEKGEGLCESSPGTGVLAPLKDLA